MDGVRVCSYRGHVYSSESLSRERFWDVQVAKITSITRRAIMPRPPSSPGQNMLRTFCPVSQMAGRWPKDFLHSLRSAKNRPAPADYAPSASPLLGAQRRQLYPDQTIGLLSVNGRSMDDLFVLVALYL